MEFNKEMSYKQLCQEMGEETIRGGNRQTVQLKRFQKKFQIEKVGRNRYIVRKEWSEQDPSPNTFSRKRYDLQIKDFAEKRYIKIFTPIDGRLKSTDVVQYECQFHKGIIQESAVYPLLKNIGCPLCTYPMSRFEVMLYLGLKDCGAIHREKIDGVEYDIILPKEKIAIEVDGEIFHSGEDESIKEQKKYEVAEKHGYKLIKIYELLNNQKTKVHREGNKIFIHSYQTATKQDKAKIISLVQELVPYEHSEELWNEAAVYMREWKRNSYESNIIRQYDSDGNLVAEYHSFNEIKNAIASGEAFGFKWKIN